MNRIYIHFTANSIFKNAFKIILMVLILISSVVHVKAQVQLISPSDGGFEGASTDFIGNGWTTVQGADNRIWRVGTAASSSSGANSAYTGTATNYNGLNLARTNHFYRDIAIPAGATNVNLSFYFRQPTIDNTYDVFYVSITDVANTPQQNVVPGANYTILYSNTANAYTNYTQMGPFDLTAYAGTTVRLVFSANSDGVAPVANPAIDVIKLSYIPSGYNMGVSAIVAPAIPACYSANETISATIVNNGNVDLDLSVNPLTINASITGPNPQLFTPIILSAGTFVAGSSQTITIASNYDMSASGTYALTTSTYVIADASSNNDTLSTSFIKYDNPIVAVTPNNAGVCQGDSILITASSQTVVTPLNYTNATLIAIPNSSPAGINSPIVSQAPTAANSIISCTVNINHIM